MINRKSTDDSKQMLIRVPEDIHKKARECALHRNISLREWVVRLLVEGIQRDTKYRDNK